MNKLMILFAGAVGYVLGRKRPYATLERWNWRRRTFGHSTPADWYLFAILHPAAIVKSIIHPPKKVEPVNLNDAFFKGANNG